LTLSAFASRPKPYTPWLPNPYHEVHICHRGPGRLEPAAVRRRRNRVGCQIARYARIAQALYCLLTCVDSIKKASKSLIANLRAYYTGDRPGDVPGNLPDPYYWWEAGAMFNAFIDYWYYTGDDTYNAITTQAMVHQIGDYNAFMPSNQSSTLGNDDQAFWGMAAMSAAENKLPDPGDGKPSWLALAQAVYNTQKNRWDDKTCGGGLRWQIFAFNKGFNYKNTISNGCFFNIAARLYKYLGNETYADWAEKAWEWELAAGLMSKDFHFFDGTDSDQNCTNIQAIQWTYNAGVHMAGAAAMWNVVSRTGQSASAGLR
jgi:mannan endo-1,6-alpha-mannosidase